MPRRFFLSIVLIVIVLTCGSAAGWLLLSTRSTPPRTEPVVVVPLVEVVAARRVDAVESLTGFGSVRADRTSDLVAEVSATVVERVGNLKAGDRVRHAQVLLRLDDRQFQHELERARADTDIALARLAQLNTRQENAERMLEIARREAVLTLAEVDRLRGLMATDQAVQKELDDAMLRHEATLRTGQAYENELALIEPSRVENEAAVRAGRAGQALAALNIERCEVKAPFDGQVVTVTAEVGERANIGASLLTVVDVSRVEIPLRLPVSTRSAVRVGAAATLDLESAPGLAWAGTVSRIDAEADVGTRTFAAYVEVINDNDARPLMPGVFVRGQVDGAPTAGALVIPRSAIRDHHVLVAADGVVSQRPIRVTRFLADDAVVTGSIEAGDAIIVTGLDWLSAGRRVRVTEGGVDAAGGADAVSRERRP